MNLKVNLGIIWVSWRVGRTVRHKFAKLARCKPRVGSTPTLSAMQNNQLIMAVALVAKKRANGKIVWLLVKQTIEEEWGFPQTAVRKGESSVRGAIRMMGEVGGMNARVIEEVGRLTSSTVINNRSTPRRILYYVMIQKFAGEMIGFKEFKWLEFSEALKRLQSKKDKEALKKAKKELRLWLEDKPKRKAEEEKEALETLEAEELEKKK